MHHLPQPRSFRRGLSRVAAALVLVGLSGGPAVAAEDPVAEPSGGPTSTASPAGATDDEAVWGVRTAANAQGVDRQNYGYTLDPGSRVDDAIVVANHGDEPIELDLYAADAYTTESGQLGALTRDETSQSVGAWLTLDEDHVSLDPGQSQEVGFTLAIPRNAEPGDYAGAVLSSLSHTGPDTGIDVDRRLGIRLHLRVSGDLAPALEVVDAHVAYHGTLNPFGTGDATVSYTVRNTGNIRLAATQAIGLTGPFGWFAVDAADVPDVPELLPGEEWQVSVDVATAVPAFRTTATAVLTAQLPQVAGSTPGIEPVRVVATGWAVPWPALALVLLVAAAVVLVLRGRRRGRRRQDARVREAVAAALRERDAEESGRGPEPSAELDRDATPDGPPAADPTPEPEPEPEPESTR